MALQHLRSSTANKRPLPAAMADGQLAANTNTASPGLFFKDSAGELVKLGPVHVGTAAPNASPAAGGETGNTTGELWLDTSVTPNQLKTWNGSAWVSDFPDEIPVASLLDGAARQLLQTDAAGTGVEWTSNVDVPGTLDVTGATTLDSTLTVPLGSAAAPTVRFTGDTNTGIYSPGADQVAVTSSSTGSLSNTAPVIAGLFQSFDDVATFTTGVAQTLFVIPNTNATYIVTLRRGSVGDAANYEAVSILSTNSGGSVSAVLTDLKTAANVLISISGTNLQGTQSSGGNASLRWIVTRVG
jgi:hypothetical protein